MNPTLSLVVPCYNEAATLEVCIARILAIATPARPLEIVVVDDASTDDSLARALALAAIHPEIRVVSHAHNQGKGAALRTGFQHVSGAFVAVQDADLEYDPWDLIPLLEPLEQGRADAVFGSRFLASGSHRVLDFWHSAGNRFLTLLSNAFTNLRLTDLETCYKVFRRDVLQSIELEEDRFGFEPEIVAKLARLRLRLYEVAIGYDARTNAEGKKIRAIDGWRAVYCIVHYNARRAPAALQLGLHASIGFASAVADVALFALIRALGSGTALSALLAYAASSGLAFWLCRHFLFPVERKDAARGERFRFIALALAGALVDVFLTLRWVDAGWAPLAAKATALLPFPLLTFLLRKRFVFRAEAP